MDKHRTTRPTRRTQRAKDCKSIATKGRDGKRRRGSPRRCRRTSGRAGQELEKRGHRRVRYADDQPARRRAGDGGLLEQFPVERLKRKVNTAKSAVAPPCVRKFVGLRFYNRETDQAAPRAPDARPAQDESTGSDAPDRRQEPRADRPRNWRGISPRWRACFGFCLLQCCANLRFAGTDQPGHRTDPCRANRAVPGGSATTLAIAFPMTAFDALGLPSLDSASRSVHRTR
jgi:hypothetical protein